MAAYDIEGGRKRIGFSAVLGSTSIPVITAVVGKKMAVVGGWVQVLDSVGGTIRMVNSDDAPSDSLMQVAQTIPAGTGRFLSFTVEDGYESTVDLGVSFLRSANMAVEGELIYREVT